MKGTCARTLRKTVRVDQRKVGIVRSALGVKTDAEATDAALDLIAFPRELEAGFVAVRRSGGIEDVLARRRHQPSGV